MKWRSTIALLVAALGLAAYVFFWDSGQKGTVEAERDKHRLFDFEASAIQWIEMDHDGTTLRIERRSQGEGDATVSSWMLAKPISDRADGSLADGLADRIARLESTRTLGGADAAGAAPPADADAGLAPPVFTVRFDAGKGPVTLDVGKAVPASDAVYLRVSGRQGLEVARNSLHEEVQRPADEWRDHALFAVSTLDLGEVELSRPAGTLRFKREGEVWRVAAPFQDDGDGSKIQSLLFNLTGLHAASFAAGSDPAGMAALATPTYRAVLRKRDGSSAGEIAFGGAVAASTTRIWARSAGRDALLQVDNQAVEPLDAPAESYRSLAAFTMNEFDIETISLERAGASLVFRYKDTGWKVDTPADLSPVADSVEAAVREAAGLRTDAVLESTAGLARYGLEPPAATITLTARAAADGTVGRTEALRLGSTASAGRIYAARDGRPVILTVPDTILERFDRAAYSTPPAEATPGAEMQGSVGQ